MNKNTFLLLVGLAIIPAGCTMAPKYTRPKAPVPADWPTGTAYQAIQPATNAPDAPGPALAGILHRRKTSTSHRDGLDEQPRSAGGRSQCGKGPGAVRHSASRTVAQRSMPPAAMIKQRIPANVEGFPEPMTIKNYSVNLGVASWEIDFFGRIRSLKDEALQQYLATEQARRSAQILLVSSVANAYLTLAADRESLALAETTLAAQQGTYNMIKRRHDLGLAADLDVQRAQTQVDGARRDIASFQQLIAQDENALNLLVGSPGAGQTPARRAGWRRSSQRNKRRFVFRGAPAPAGCASSRGSAQGGQRRHRRRPGGILPANFPDGRHRHRQQRSSPASSSPAQAPGTMRRRLSCRFSMPAPGRRTRPPKCNGKSP